MRIAGLSRGLVALAATGCYRGSPAPKPSPVEPADPPIVIALATGHFISVVEVTPSATKVRREAEVPGDIIDVRWIGGDPVVLLEHPPREQCIGMNEGDEKECRFDPAFDGVIGRLTAKGFVAFPALPAKTWAALPEPTEEQHECDTGCWTMTESDGAIYQGHCRAAEYYDGQSDCGTWRYARIDPPGDATVYEKVPDRAPKQRPAAAAVTTKRRPFVVKPSPRIALSFDALGDEPNDLGEKSLQLSCTLDGEVTKYPADVAELDLGMQPDVEWLSTDPPIFVAYHSHNGFTGWNDVLLFEGCTPTQISGIEHTHLDDLILVDGARLLYRRGKLVGRTDGGRFAVLGP